jgi:phosphoesterase RecJ-like protein
LKERHLLAIDQIVAHIRDGREFILTLHENPDGDSVGSSLAMALALRSLGKRAVVATPDPLPKAFSFLTGADEVVPWEMVTGGFDVALIIDCGDLNRFGSVGRAAVTATPVIINIDHHQTNSGFGHVNYVDPGAAAACEQVLGILGRLGYRPGKDVATCLLTGLMTDTGCFRYSNTGPSTLRSASRMVAAGGSPALVAERVYDTRSLASLRLLTLALGTLSLSRSGRVAWMVIRRDDYLSSGASDSEAEGIVNYARTISGVEVGVVFRETLDGKVRIAFRSRHEVDVSRLALAFGGGGHARAAGCLFDGPLEQGVERILGAVLAEAKDER